MTTAKEKVAGRVLMDDVRQWQRGEYPQEVHLATAPVLEEWQVIWELGTMRPLMKLQGIVTGSPKLPSGEVIRTSPIVLLDRDFGWCRTNNSFFRLGQQAGIDVPIDGIWT
jgi:hypothetical protein